MAEYMIGTLSDYPLLKVALNGVHYLVDKDKKQVFLDVEKIPEVTDKKTVAAVLEAAQ